MELYTMNTFYIVAYIQYLSIYINYIYDIYYKLYQPINLYTITFIISHVDAITFIISHVVMEETQSCLEY